MSASRRTSTSSLDGTRFGRRHERSLHRPSLVPTQVKPMPGGLEEPKPQVDSLGKVDQEYGFARRRVVVMRHRGKLANKMLQYMGAVTLASRIQDCSIVGVSLPEW